MIKAISDIWYNDKILSKDDISRSFRHTGILCDNEEEINEKINLFK